MLLAPLLRRPRGGLLPLALLSALACALPALSAVAAPITLQLRTAAGQPVADAVVAVELRGRPQRTSTAKAEMGQRDRSFQPPVLVVQTGTAVSFPNFDTVRHHVYSFSPVKVFDIKLYAGTPAEPVVFDKPGVAALGCNIHDRMSAHIVVVDTPLFARTDARGEAVLDLPAGEHRVLSWHAAQKQPQQLQAQPIDVSASAKSLVVTLPD
jgi:plastocyanin